MRIDLREMAAQKDRLAGYCGRVTLDGVECPDSYSKRQLTAILQQTYDLIPRVLQDLMVTLCGTTSDGKTWVHIDSDDPKE